MKLGIIFGIALLLVLPLSAFAQIQNTIVVTTDKTSYSEGETIFITGEVRDIYAGTPVSMIIKAPNGNMVSIMSLTVGTDKKFGTEVTAGGSLMRAEGTYTIVATYGNENRSATTTFEFGGSPSSPTENDVSGSVTDDTVYISGTDKSIKYTLSGARLLNITPDTDSYSLIISIDSFNDGLLTLILPREVIDSKFNNVDSEFFVIVDGEDKNYSELPDSDSRTIVLQFRAGVEEIEIVGNYLLGYQKYSQEEAQACVGCSMEDARAAANEMLLDEPPVSVWTDRTSYDHNDMIMVYGQVANLAAGFPVTVSVLSPLESIVTHDQLTVNSDGSFETTLNTAGAMWKYDGTYTIRASYGSSEKSDSVKVQLTGGVDYSPRYSTPSPEPEPEPEPEPREKIPQWIKNNAKWWHEGQINDDSFVNGIQHLMERKIVNIPDLPAQTSEKARPSFVDDSKDPQSYIDRYNNEPNYKEWFDDNYPDYTIEEAVGITVPIPGWIKNTASWWADDLISEEEFIKGIEFLVEKRILKVN